MATKRVEQVEIECGAPDCSVRFTPKRGTAKYHTATCQRRAARARAAAAAEEKADDATAEHSLVKALRVELAQVGKLNTFDGQMALELARRAVAVDSNLTAFDKLEVARRRALGLVEGGPAAAGVSAEPEDDEVTKAREARERKRAAAVQA